MFEPSDSSGRPQRKRKDLYVLECCWKAFPDDIHFVRVEGIFLQLQNDKKEADRSTLADLCYQRVAKEVQDVLSSGKKAAILEVTGVAPQLSSLMDTLKSRHCLQYVKVMASPEVCLQRVQERDSSQQIPVSLERVAEINQWASTVAFPWDLEMDNNSFQSEEEIVKLLLRVLRVLK